MDRAEIILHDRKENGECMADIILPESGMQVNDLKVMKGTGGGVQVHMPPWMHTRWNYPEIQWSEVRRLVTAKYQQESRDRECLAEKQQENRETVPPADKIFTFYGAHLLKESMAELTFPKSGTRVDDIGISVDDKMKMSIYYPRWMNKKWRYSEMEWKEVCAAIEEAYVRREEADYDGGPYHVRFRKETDVLACLADVKLPGRKGLMKGFRLKARGKEIIISLPKWMDRWRDASYTWTGLCSMMKKEFNAWRENGAGESAGVGSSTEKSSTAETAEKNTAAESMAAEKQVFPAGEEIPTSEAREPEAAQPGQSGPEKEEEKSEAGKSEAKEKNEYGRIKNALNSTLRYYPRTVLRTAESGEKKKMFELVNALSRGSLGGIGPFEIHILDWISRLRYVSSTMLLDMFRGGYISFGWRETVTQSKLAKIISRMNQYDLIEISNFVTVDDNGLPQEDGKMTSVMRILTLGRTGNTMLHELGRSDARYNAFDTFQDGNTVKRYLAANQWLIYWLTAYPKAVEDNYETAEVIYQKGSDFAGARFYATVTCNNYTMVAEPLRRVEEFEKEEANGWIRSKFQRFLSMFSNLDELYLGQEEISFGQRPALVYICEDDEHMHELLAVLAEDMKANPEQTVWFTTDLRIFNYNMAGKRFLTPVNGQLEVVDLQAVMGVQESLEECGAGQPEGDDGEENDAGQPEKDEL